MQSLRLNNSRILRIKNEKLSEYYFYMNKNIQGDFQICISIPLTLHQNVPIFSTSILETSENVCFYFMIGFPYSLNSFTYNISLAW